MSFVDTLFNEVVTPFLEPRIKKTSITAVKTYVKTIEGLHKAAIGLIGFSAIAAVFVAGLVLVVVSIIGLLPIDPHTALLATLVIGLGMTGVGGFLVYGGLREEVWLEKSKANEMVQAVLKPWPTAYSVPDPRRIFSGEDETASNTENRELSRANRSRGESAYDNLEAELPRSPMPQAQYASLDTPDAALVSRSIDTTTPLERPLHP